MYPVSAGVKALFDNENKQVLRITHGSPNETETTVGPAPVATATNAMAYAALEVLTNISATQAGSGEPTPTNIRPITGHGGIMVYHSGIDVSNARTYNIAFPADPGIVYGGTYDMQTGVLTVTHEAKIFTGSESFAAPGSGVHKYVRTEIAESSYAVSNSAVCSHFKQAIANTSNTANGANVTTASSKCWITFRWLTDDDTRIESTSTAWKAYLKSQYDAGTPVTVMYKLTTARTYQIGANPITMLYGTNNIWANGGDTTVTYTAHAADYIQITDAEVMTGGFSIDRYACNGDRIEVGTAIAAEMTLNLDNRNGQYGGVTFEGVELFAEVGIADWSQPSPTINWVPCGYFTSYEQPRALNTITLHALDRMTLFDIALNESSLTFPSTVSNLVGQICTLCGVTLAASISSLPNASFSIAAMPTTDGKISYRTLLQWCAGLMGTNAWMDWDGKLRFSWFDNVTGYNASTANRFSSDLYENAIVITGVKLVEPDADETVRLAGADTYALDLTGNRLFKNGSGLLTAIYNVVHDYAYTPFLASVVSAPYLWPMDRVTFTDKDGNGHVSMLSNVNFKLNGRTTLQAVGETGETYKLMPPSNFTNDQQQELARISRETSTEINTAVSMATSVINGANGSEIRYIHDANDKLIEIVIMDSDDINTAVKVWRWNSGGLGYSSNGYAGPYTLAITQNGAIVADFITTGKLNADRIYGGTVTLGGNGNVNGQLKILDASGNVIGEWNSTIFSVNTAGSNGTLRLDGDGGHLSKAIIGDLDCPNAAKVYTGTGSITVGKSTSTFLSLQEACSALNGKFVNKEITITLEADMYEEVDLAGVSGAAGAGISIVGGGYTIYGRMTIRYMQPRVALNNVKLVGDTSSSNALLINGCPFVYIYNSTIDGAGCTGADTEAIYTFASNLRLDNVALYNATSLLECAYLSHVLTASILGGNCTNFLYARASVVHMTGTRPDGAYNGGWGMMIKPDDPTTLTVDSGSVQPAPPTTTTSTLNCTASGHYWNGWESGNNILQGKYDNATYAGCMWFDTTAISGKTIRSATLTIRRLNGFGTWDTTKLYLCGTTLASKSGNPITGYTSYGSIGSLSENTSGTFAVPVAAIQALANGTIKGLMLYIASDTNSRGNIYSDNFSAYAGYNATGAPTLSVTYDT